MGWDTQMISIGASGNAHIRYNLDDAKQYKDSVESAKEMEKEKKEETIEFLKKMKAEEVARR